MRRLITYIFLLILLVLPISAWGDEREVISSIDDLDGKPVVTLTGSVQDMLLVEKCPHSRILRTDSEADLFIMVSTGKVCATAMSSIAWQTVGKFYPDIVQVGEGINPKPIAFAFKKDADGLREKFDAFLTKTIRNGEIEHLVAKWLDLDSHPEMPVISDKEAVNGTLHVAVAALIPPFNFIMNNAVVGVEPELVARFAASQGMKCEFIDINFSGLIAYIQSDRADIAAAVMCVTPERQKNVDFSVSYMEESSVLLVNKQYAPEELIVEADEDNLSFWQRLKSKFEDSVIKENRYMLLVDGLKSTVLISILSAIFGTILGVLLCLALGRNNSFVSGSAKIYIDFMRCMPQVVLLMIMFYVVFANSQIDGIWVAVIAFSLCFAAYSGVIFRSSADSIDKGQTEAALSMGFSKFKTILFIIVPQTVLRALPVYRSEFISLVKATSVVGYIAVMDLTKAGDIIRSRTYEALFPLLLITAVYFLVIWLLGIFLDFIEKKSRPSRKKFFK